MSVLVHMVTLVCMPCCMTCWHVQAQFTNKCGMECWPTFNPTPKIVRQSEGPRHCQGMSQTFSTKFSSSMSKNRSLLLTFNKNTLLIKAGVFVALMSSETLMSTVVRNVRLNPKGSADCLIVSCCLNYCH